MAQTFSLSLNQYISAQCQWLRHSILNQYIYQPSVNGLEILSQMNIYICISAQCQWLRHSILNQYIYIYIYISPVSMAQTFNP